MKLKDLSNKAGDEICINYVSLKDLENTFLEGNSKKHNTTKLIDSIQRYGFRDPLTFDPSLNEGEGGVVEGNGRLQSLVEMRDKGMNIPRGIKDKWLVPVIFGVGAKTEAEAVAYSVEHNWSVTWGSDIDLNSILSMFDDNALSEQLDFLQQESSLPISLGDDLEEILEHFGLTDEEESENIERDASSGGISANIEPRCEVGQIWQLGRHKILVGDCLDEVGISKLLEGESPGLIWSDPPYGMKCQASDGRIGGEAKAMRQKRIQL